MVRPIDPTHRSFVSYINKSREFYTARGYANPYRWACHDDAPFSRLSRPLAESVVTLITTAHWVQADGDTPWLREVYSMESASAPDHLSTDGLFWDRNATHTDDLDSFFPIHRLHEFTAEGRIGRLARRLHGVPTEYSQRSTRERDAPEILRRCKEDDVNAALLVPL